MTGDMDVTNRGHPPAMSKGDGITMGGTMLRPKSRGHVTAITANNCDQPQIVHNFLGHDEDIRLTIKAMDIARKVAETPALKAIIRNEMYPGLDCKSFDEKVEFQKNYGTSLYHPVGTCRMGDDSNAVVDPQLRVNGTKNLRVVDASVMPLIISGNTNAATMAIAEKAADIILK